MTPSPRVTSSPADYPPCSLFPLHSCIRLLLQGRFASPAPGASSCPGSLSRSPGSSYLRHRRLDPRGYGGPLRATGTSAEITSLTAPLHFPGMKLVIRRRRSWLLICVTLQLTAFLACTIFRPQTTPFFCVWKACSSCWALGTNPALYRELRKLLSPKRTAILGHLD